MRQDAGVPFLTKQGYGPSSRDEETITGLFLNCDWTLSITLEGEGYVEELPELRQGCQGTFLVSRRNVGFLSRRCRGKGPHLVLRAESPGLSRVAAGNLVFLSSYDRDLRGPLMLPQKVQSPCDLRGASQDSSPVGAES